MKPIASKGSCAPEVLRLRPTQLGVLFACVAIALYLAFVMYVDSDIEKQTRKGDYSVVAMLAAAPMLLGFLQFMPLYILVGESILIAGILTALAYFVAGLWAGHIFRDKVFNSKMHATRFYIFTFCSTALIFSILGGTWWYFACKNASC